MIFPTASEGLKVDPAVGRVDRLHFKVLSIPGSVGTKIAFTMD
jgi:hypothetical protein